MTSLTPPLRTAQAIGIISASFLSGGLLTLSALLTPALTLVLPPNLLLLWRKTYLVGRAIGPLLALLSSSSFTVLSYQLASTLDQARAERFAVAAGAVIAIVPYTRLVMGGVNGELWGEMSDGGAKGEGEEGGERVRGLVGRWIGLNFWRGGLPLAGAVLGAWATLG